MLRSALEIENRIVNFLCKEVLSEDSTQLKLARLATRTADCDSAGPLTDGLGAEEISGRAHQYSAPSSTFL